MLSRLMIDPMAFKVLGTYNNPPVYFITQHIFLWDVAVSSSSLGKESVVLTLCFSFFSLSRSADFDEPESKKAYEEAYVEILNFFQKHL